MRRRLLAFVFGVSLFAAAPALAETAADCQKLADVAVAASNKARALKDEEALYRAVLGRSDADAQLVYVATVARLDVMLKATDRLIRDRRAKSTDKSLDPDAREKARVDAFLFDQWYEFLLETRTRKAAGLEVDRSSNKFTKTLDRAKRRIAKMAPLIAFAEVEAKEAVQAQLACWAKVRAAGKRTDAPSTPSGLGPRTGAYSTNYGEMRLTVNGASVSGTYYDGSGRLTGTVSDGVLTGYWMQSSGPERCTAPHDGSWYWGKVEWRYQYDGSWIGAMGYCDEYPSRPGWDGQPKSAPPA